MTMANEKRLISAEQAYEVARLHHNDFAQSIADLASLREVLEDCDTVDAVEVVRGLWNDGDPYCPVCGKDKFAGLEADERVLYEQIEKSMERQLELLEEMEEKQKCQK